MSRLFAFAFALSLLFLGTVSSSPLPTRVERRQAAGDAAASLALASSALSIYNNQGTQAFTQPTAVGAACPVGYQSFVDADSGLTECCSGSIVNNRCFEDGGTLVYTADPESVIEAGGVGGATGLSTAVVAVTTSTGAAAVSALTSGGSVVTAASSKPTTGTYTITSYVPVATGGTQNGLAASSTSYSRLSQTLTPTGGSGGPSVYKPNGAVGASPATMWLPVAVAVCVALVGGGGAALW